MSPRKVRFQTSINESDENEAMKTFLLFESGHCGHLTLTQFKQAVIELETYDQVRRLFFEYQFARMYICLLEEC